MSEEMQPHYYMNIPAFVWDDKDLLRKPKAILLYGHISTLANKKGYCWATNDYFGKRLGISKKSVVNYINLLVCKGYIKRTIKYKEGTKQVKKRFLSIYTTPGITDYTSPGVNDDTTPGITDYTENNTRNNNTSINNKKDILSSSHSTAAHEIVDYLNSKIGTHYRATTRKTQSLIKARMNEGATVEDFKTVIDNKVSEWGNDSKMSKYLRPETLFSTKFEGYLNQAAVKTKKSKRINTLPF